MLETAFQLIDPGLAPKLRRALSGAARRPPPDRLVLAGHRAAGKSSLLPIIATALGRQPVDLDAHLAKTARRSLATWIVEDEASFRSAEREAFAQLDPHAVIAVGGGFLALHAELLQDRTVVLVPISFETYRERLLADSTRPRLRPALSLEEELQVVFEEREALHRRVPTMPLVELLASVPEHG